MCRQIGSDALSVCRLQQNTDATLNGAAYQHLQRSPTATTHHIHSVNIQLK
jgi:hypothetical protein